VAGSWRAAAVLHQAQSLLRRLPHSPFNHQQQRCLAQQPLPGLLRQC
jgi:hypothetical protein